MELHYSLKDFDDMIYDGYDYTLPLEILHNIRNIQTQMGNAPTISLRPATKHIRQEPRRWNTKTYEPKVEFKATPSIVISEEGIGKHLQIIRTTMNKISQKNYETQLELIKNIILPYLSTEKGTESEIDSIICLILDVSSQNTFLSELYSQLYKDLILCSPLFQTKLTEYLLEYRKSLKDMRRMDKETEEAYAKRNDKKRAMSTFLIQLMKSTIITVPVIYEIIEDIIAFINAKMGTVGNRDSVNECVEHIFIFVSLGISTFQTSEFTDEWDVIYENLLTLSQLKMDSEKLPGISSRSLYKLEDLCNNYC